LPDCNLTNNGSVGISAAICAPCYQVFAPGRPGRSLSLRPCPSHAFRFRMVTRRPASSGLTRTVPLAILRGKGEKEVYVYVHADVLDEVRKPLAERGKPAPVEDHANRREPGGCYQPGQRGAKRRLHDRQHAAERRPPSAHEPGLRSEPGQLRGGPGREILRSAVGRRVDPARRYLLVLEDRWVFRYGRNHDTGGHEVVNAALPTSDGALVTRAYPTTALRSLPIFTVECSSDSATGWGTVTTTSADTANYIYSSIAAGNDSYYRVKATKAGAVDSDWAEVFGPPHVYAGCALAHSTQASARRPGSLRLRSSVKWTA